MYRSSQKRCSSKKSSKKIYQIQGKTPVLESLFNKYSGQRLATLLKKRLHQRFFLWICKVFKNTYFTEHFPTNSSFSTLSHSFILQRSFIYLFDPSFVRKRDKNSKFTHFFPFANTFYAQNINTRNHVSLMQEYY